MLLGHETAWREWHEALAGERMHHAWLLAGRRGVGKGNFALAAARELVGADQTEAQHHPDILIRYSKVTLTLSTHDAGGITEKDFDLAKKADEAA